MPITINCPFCDYTRQVPDGYPNKQARCPKCGTFMPVPQPEEETRRGIPPWVIGLLIALGVLALFVLGSVAIKALRGGGDEDHPPTLEARSQANTSVPLSDGGENSASQRAH